MTSLNNRWHIQYVTAFKKLPICYSNTVLQSLLDSKLLGTFTFQTVLSSRYPHSLHVHPSTIPIPYTSFLYIASDEKMQMGLVVELSHTSFSDIQILYMLLWFSTVDDAAVRTAIMNENACNPVLRASARSVLTVNMRWVLDLYVRRYVSDCFVYLAIIAANCCHWIFMEMQSLCMNLLTSLFLGKEN